MKVPVNWPPTLSIGNGPVSKLFTGGLKLVFITRRTPFEGMSLVVFMGLMTAVGVPSCLETRKFRLWVGIMKQNERFFNFPEFVEGDGRNIRFTLFSLKKSR